MVPIWNGSNLGSFQNGSRVGYPAMSDEPCFPHNATRSLCRTVIRLSTPGTVTTDRGYGEANVDRELTDLGVKNVVIPRKGKPSQARRSDEHRPAFRRTIKWRTGSEGRISTLKSGYGWDRTRIDGTEGARIWTGHGVLTHNLVKISALAA